MKKTGYCYCIFRIDNFKVDSAPKIETIVTIMGVYVDSELLDVEKERERLQDLEDSGRNCDYVIRKVMSYRR